MYQRQIYNIFKQESTEFTESIGPNEMETV